MNTGSATSSSWRAARPGRSRGQRGRVGLPGPDPGCEGTGCPPAPSHAWRASHAAGRAGQARPGRATLGLPCRHSTDPIRPHHPPAPSARMALGLRRPGHCPSTGAVELADAGPALRWGRAWCGRSVQALGAGARGARTPGCRDRGASVGGTAAGGSPARCGLTARAGGRARLGLGVLTRGADSGCGLTWAGSRGRAHVGGGSGGVRQDWAAVREGALQGRKGRVGCGRSDGWAMDRLEGWAGSWWRARRRMRAKVLSRLGCAAGCGGAA